MVKNRLLVFLIILSVSLSVYAQYKRQQHQQGHGGGHGGRGGRGGQQQQQKKEEPTECYYKTLGVAKSATEPQIKKAFKKLSIKYHPDKNKDRKDWAKDQFVKIANAYETLTDQTKRRIYDQGGEEGLKDHTQREQQGGGQRGGFNMDGNYEDIFSDFFGRGGGGHGHGHGHGQPQGPSFENTDVYTLTINNLTKLLNRNENWFVLFFKSNQKEVKALADTMKTLGEKTYGIFKVAVVNCDSDEELCDEFQAFDTPMILFFHESTEEPEKYKGIKDWEKMFQYASGKMLSYVRNINDLNYGDFVTSNLENNKVLLFTSKKVTPPLFKAISKKYSGKLYLGEVRSTETELIQRFKVTKFPTLLVISDPETYEAAFYEGSMGRDNIEKFLNKFAYEIKKVEKKAVSAKELTERVYNMGNCNNNDNKNICFIYIVKEPKNDIDSQDMQILNSLTDRYVNDPFKFYYVLESNYGHLWSSFELKDKGANLLVIKGKRKRYLPLFVENEDGEWTGLAHNTIDRILSGSGQFKNMIKKINFAKVLKDDL
jgi:thioredoxin-like negative regulator of GroEL